MRGCLSLGVYLFPYTPLYPIGPLLLLLRSSELNEENEVAFGAATLFMVWVCTYSLWMKKFEI